LPPRIKRIEVQGFRSFGTSRQSVELPDSVAAFWGGNSQGKTSFAEAFEFLFTGQIIRREILGSSKDEFCDALRNAHLPATTPVQVRAEVLCGDGQSRQLTRTLIEDYSKTATGCRSRLEIEGQPAAEGDISSVLGIALSQPPLRAPVLTQHTLGYIFSASPAERATYFRAVLDTQDLEDFRQIVSQLKPLLATPALAGLTNVAEIERIKSAPTSAASIRQSISLEQVQSALSDTIGALLLSLSVTPSGTIADQADQLQGQLEGIQSKTFPLALLGRKLDVPWADLPSNSGAVMERFETERAAIDIEARRLIDLYSAALALPRVQALTGDMDCPLCLTSSALNEARRDALTAELRKAQSYQIAEAEMRATLTSIKSALELLLTRVETALPKLLLVGPTQRRVAGFTTARLLELTGDTALVQTWTAALLDLARSASILRRAVRSACEIVQLTLDDMEVWQGAAPLSKLVRTARKLYDRFSAASAAYTIPAGALYEPLKAVVDQATSTGGWSALIDCCKDPYSLTADLAKARLLEARRKDLDKALAEIDAGNGKVQDEKFEDLSGQVAEWWERLRPDEATYFESVQRRSATARRTIDLRVALSPNEDRSEAKARNAVAVLSQSQLHCLGLALFLARAVKEQSGFVVLDDPVLTSDDDFRPNFNSSVIEALLDGGVQVIVLTQDHRSWKDIGHRWSFRSAEPLQLVRNDVRLETELSNESDTIATMLANAQPLIRSQEPTQRKRGAALLRQAIERFGKELIVQARVNAGDSSASITDYDGKDFGTYKADVLSRLTKDPAHPGKLTAAYAYVTPGPHDDTPPSTAELKMASGDVKHFKKAYLD